MNHSELTAQLHQELNEAKHSAKQIERDALQSFESDLKQQYSIAASTLRSALAVSRAALLQEIKRENKDLMSTISADSKELRNQLAILKRELQDWTPKLTLAVKWTIFLPILSTFGVCLLMAMGTWFWMPRELWNLQTSRQIMTDGRRYLVIDDPDWTICNLAVASGKLKIPRPCKTVEPINPAK